METFVGSFPEAENWVVESLQGEATGRRLVCLTRRAEARARQGAAHAAPKYIV
jgi:hypothetical protein